jgi:hypothetical protein
MGLVEDLRAETNRFIEEHYAGLGGVSRLGRELAPMTGRSPRSIAQAFSFYAGQGDKANQNPDKFFLYYVKGLCHPAAAWAYNCLKIYADHGDALPGWDEK